MSGPFNRVIEAVVALANKIYGKPIPSTGNRLADCLEVIATEAPGKVKKQAASTAADAAALKADFNALLNKLKDAGVMEPETFTMQFADVADSVSGHADRQANTDEIQSVAEEGGVITITLKKKVNALKDFDGQNGWGVHKWLGIGIGVGINPITGLKYNGSALAAGDVSEATACGLSAGYFVRWVAADLVLAGDETQKSKSTFTLAADGYGVVPYTIKIVEP